MRCDVRYNNRNFSDFNIRAVCQNPEEMAQPDIETTHVNGMNGDLHFHYGSYQNVDISYTCALGNDYRTMFRAFRNWLIGLGSGYKKLWDEAYPDEFRMGTVISTPELGEGRSFTLTFSCRPERFLTSGEMKKKFSSSGTVYNPTSFSSLPLVRVYGTGTLSIGKETITISKNNDFIDIDSEIQDTYCGTENMNGNIILSSGDFFHLDSGSNGIDLASGMSIEITPRWYRL